MARPSKWRGLTSRDWTSRDQVARVDIARPNYPDQIKQRWTIFAAWKIVCHLGKNVHYQTKHPAAISDTRMGQDSQNRAVHVGTAPVRSQHVAPRGRLGSSRQRLMQLLPLLIPTPLTSSLLAPDRPRLRPRCCCCCCCRHAAVGPPYERR